MRGTFSCCPPKTNSCYLRFFSESGFIIFRII